SCQQGLPRIAYGEDHGAQEVSIAQEIGHDGRYHRPGNDRPSRSGPKSDQRAGGNACGRPEHRHAVGSEQCEAKFRREDIEAADHDSEPAQAHPPPRRISRVGSRRDERAALHSITSSARAKNVSGIMRPNALAVLRLTISSNFVGCSIGRSAGFAPLKILSTKVIERRKVAW